MQDLQQDGVPQFGPQCPTPHHPHNHPFLYACTVTYGFEVRVASECVVSVAEEDIGTRQAGTARSPIPFVWGTIYRIADRFNNGK